MGMGYWLTERFTYDPDSGQLLTHNTWVRIVPHPLTWFSFHPYRSTSHHLHKISQLTGGWNYWRMPLIQLGYYDPKVCCYKGYVRYTIIYVCCTYIHNCMENRQKNEIQISCAAVHYTDTFMLLAAAHGKSCPKRSLACVSKIYGILLLRSLIRISAMVYYC